MARPPPTSAPSVSSRSHLLLCPSSVGFSLLSSSTLMAFSGRFTNTLLLQADRLDIVVPRLAPAPRVGAALPPTGPTLASVATVVDSFIQCDGVVAREDVSAYDARAASIASSMAASSPPRRGQQGQGQHPRGVGDPHGPSEAVEMDGAPGVEAAAAVVLAAAAAAAAPRTSSPRTSPLALLKERRELERQAREAALGRVCWATRKAFLGAHAKGRLAGAMRRAQEVCGTATQQDRLYSLLRHYTEDITPADAVALASYTIATPPDSAMGAIPNLAQAFKRQRRAAMDRERALASLAELNEAVEEERVTAAAEAALNWVQQGRGGGVGGGGRGSSPFTPSSSSLSSSSSSTTTTGLRPVGSFQAPSTSGDAYLASPQPKALPAALAARRNPPSGGTTAPLLDPNNETGGGRGDPGFGIQGHFSRKATVSSSLASVRTSILGMHAAATATAPAPAPAPVAQSAPTPPAATAFPISPSSPVPRAALGRVGQPSLSSSSSSMSSPLGKTANEAMAALHTMENGVTLLPKGVAVGLGGSPSALLSSSSSSSSSRASPGDSATHGLTTAGGAAGQPSDLAAILAVEKRFKEWQERQDLVLGAALNSAGRQRQQGGGGLFARMAISPPPPPTTSSSTTARSLSPGTGSTTKRRPPPPPPSHPQPPSLSPSHGTKAAAAGTVEVPPPPSPFPLEGLISSLTMVDNNKGAALDASSSSSSSSHLPFLTQFLPQNAQARKNTRVLSSLMALAAGVGPGQQQQQQGGGKHPMIQALPTPNYLGSTLNFADSILASTQASLY